MWIFCDCPQILTEYLLQPCVEMENAVVNTAQNILPSWCFRFYLGRQSINMLISVPGQDLISFMKKNEAAGRESIVKGGAVIRGLTSDDCSQVVSFEHLLYWSKEGCLVNKYLGERVGSMCNGPEAETAIKLVVE